MGKFHQASESGGGLHRISCCSHPHEANDREAKVASLTNETFTLAQRSSALLGLVRKIQLNHHLRSRGATRKLVDQF
jgi:hypothetical protein